MKNSRKKRRIDKKASEKELFIIHNITQLFSEEGISLDNYKLTLFPVREHNLNIDSDEDTQIDVQNDFTVNRDVIKDYTEGQFVYMRRNKKGEIKLSKGIKDTRARQHIMTNNRLRAQIALGSTAPEPTDFKLSENEQVFSYHVNVGHGNCSFIVIDSLHGTKIWCVDSSEWDYLSKKSYRSNIEECLTYISEKFNIKDIKIEKFFLTHPHYDHFSGFIYLIKKYASKYAEFWINPYYSFSSTSYNKLLHVLNSCLRSRTLKIIESYPWNNTPNISILNENQLILRSKPTGGSTSFKKLVASGKLASSNPYTVQKNVNNSSIIYHFKFGDKSILFPGDIEDLGWKNIKNCMPYLSRANYYCLSHHGSMNGHIRSSCPAKRPINDVRLCSPLVDVLFIQGRDGAYPGIINKKLLSDFKITHPLKHIYRTDQDPSKRSDPLFFEITWLNDTVVYKF